MRIMVAPGRARLAIGLLAVASLGAVYVAIQPPPAPRALVLTPAQRIVAEPGIQKVEVSYRIANRGGRDLTIHRTRSSCGCTVASVEPRVIPPGGKGVVTLRATPPAAGERPVSVVLETNSVPDPEVHLELTLVGKREPPFVVEGSEVVQFGPILEERVEAVVWITSHEHQGSRPWLDSARSDMPDLRLEGGLVEEGPRLGDVIIRRYRYTAELTATGRAPGPIRGELILSGVGRDKEVRLPVTATIRPPVVASPAALMATVISGESMPRFTLLLSPGRPGFELEAEPCPENDPSIRVEPRGAAGGGLVFDITAADHLRLPVETSLVMTTNHPECPTVRVPVIIRAAQTSLADRIP